VDQSDHNKAPPQTRAEEVLVHGMRTQPSKQPRAAPAPCSDDADPRAALLPLPWRPDCRLLRLPAAAGVACSSGS
jgi:hypothetical protein